jgi:cytochrome c-type biogenesis protein
VAAARFIRAPDAGRGDSASFAFGVFSGVASSCCAPVLAGVMTSSALAASPVGGAALGLAYVFGMVFPLLVMALAWDKLRLAGRRIGHPRPVRMNIAGRTLVTSTVNVVVAAGFAVMGGFIIYLASAGQMTSGPGFQVAIGRGAAANAAPGRAQARRVARCRSGRTRRPSCCAPRSHARPGIPGSALPTGCRPPW